ncbi:AtpZ/AtpI family protein [Crassaminicella indica]|uniref:AtpZ/AtpI family protein n=1 Tax=Crassaminicella indica TaxID=2855394 RepID=A0ABX8RE92_9CLOT|nr:AtpZ/AtpI family protein [Crassaminicella indica]QXM06714.1 AtpZ/AtpI family protein [Crassaminicella indica]
MRNYSNIFKNLALLTHIGILMIIPIFGAVYLGNLVDQKLGTNNIFLIAFIILGVGSGFLNVYKVVMKDIKKKK